MNIISSNSLALWKFKKFCLKVSSIQHLKHKKDGYISNLFVLRYFEILFLTFYKI